MERARVTKQTVKGMFDLSVLPTERGGGVVLALHCYRGRGGKMEQRAKMELQGKTKVSNHFSVRTVR